MNGRGGGIVAKTTVYGLLALVCLAAPQATLAAIQYLGDGAIQNGATGGWDLPAQGFCLNQPSATTRPGCLALRLNPIPNNSATCTGATIKGAWATSGVCNDLVHNSVNDCVSSCTVAGFTDEVSCEENDGLWVGRVWNAAVNVCAISMEDQDRNAVVCAKSKGNWITSGTCVGVWAFPAADSYNPPLLNSTAAAGSSSSSTGPGTGDQCLRCHNSLTHYNGSRVRDVEDVLYMGHKNMSRKVVPGAKWGGPPLHCTDPQFLSEEECEANGESWYPVEAYPSDESGNPFNWVTGQITVNGTPANLYWIFADWLSPLPRAIYVAGSNATTGKPLMSYSCARCHTTGWTSDSAVGPSTGNLAKEPEKSFPGITWDGATLNTTGKVNLAGGVSGDTNKYASWDLFGISCTRCHGSAIENTSNGGVRPFTAPVGMSTHHSNLTATDYQSACSVAGGTATCVANGGVIFYGVCTDSRFGIIAGQAMSVSKTTCETAGNTNVEPAPGSGFGVWLTPCSNDNYGDQASCQANGGTWTLPTASCSVAGLCNNIAGGPYTDQASCIAAPLANCPGGVTCQWAAATNLAGCLDADGDYTGTLPNRGQTITSLCMQCHRQETSGLPYADSGSGVGSGSTSHPGSYVKVGAYHSTVTYPSHPHGNMFLNSPHGKFSGTFNQIATATLGNGYASFFQLDGEAGGTGNGCTGCHNPHRSSVEQAGIEEAIKPCQECHSGPYEVDLSKINHLATAGTPLDPNTVGHEESAPCITCHMPKGEHMFRINADPSYSTFPMPAAMTSITNATTAADGAFASAVWVDVDAACGQCHGGGTAQATTALRSATNTASSDLDVQSTAGFAVGQRITVADAGNFAYDGDSVAHGDFESYVVAVTPPNTIKVVGPPPFVVSSGKLVVQNPTKNGAYYRTKSQLAQVAKNMHSNAQLGASISFSATASNLTVNVDADVTCGSNSCPAFTYDWDWGDGSSHGSGEQASHGYATAGTKSITLTVKLLSANANNTTVGTLTRTVRTTAADSAPVAGANCNWNANSWTMTVQDTSTDGDSTPVRTTVVDWGDKSTRSVGGAGTQFTHVNVIPGDFTVTLRAIDSALNISAPVECSMHATPSYFTISGKVTKHDGTTAVASAVVAIKKGTRTIKNVFTSSNGLFSAGGLKPDTYTLVVTKSGYVFPAVAPITVGPSSANNNVAATTP